MYDLIIIGAGAGGIAAGIISAKEKINTLLIAKEVLEPAGEDDLGFLDIKKLVKIFNELVKNRKLEFKDKTEVVALEKNIVSFSVETKNGAVFYAKSIIIATGKSSLDYDHITQKDKNGKIKIDSAQRTSVPGVFAIGLAAESIFKNPLIDIGEGAKAVANIKNRVDPPAFY